MSKLSRIMSPFGSRNCQLIKVLSFSLLLSGCVPDAPEPTSPSASAHRQNIESGDNPGGNGGINGGNLPDVHITEKHWDNEDGGWNGGGWNDGGWGGSGGWNGGGGIEYTPPIETGGTEPVSGDTPELQLFESDYKKRMTQQETAIYESMDRVKQVAYLINAQTAEASAEALYPGPGLEDGKGDAYRHALFSVLNTRTIGIDLAKRLGDAHEEMLNPSNLQRNQQLMDLHNNQMGRGVPMHNGLSASQTARDLLNSGQLWIIENGSLVVYRP